jgi:glycosyltransferase involved in cell wall biosynthesis
MPPAVTIILATFDRLELLRPAVASAFAQSFEDWELVIADDGSGAETRAYLQELHGLPRVKVIWLRHIGRPSVVRNAALREARGEYVAFLDSDDVWLPNKLEIQIASLRGRAPRQWSYTKFILVDPAGNSTAWQRARGWPVPDGWILEKLLTPETVIALPSVMVRRELLDRIGGFDENLTMCEDYDLWLRLAILSEVDAVDEPLTRVTRHAQHYGSERVSYQDCARVFEKLLKTEGTEHVHSILREKHAEVTAGLAGCCAAGGDRWDALSTLASSARYGWRHRRWWRGVVRAAAGALSSWREPLSRRARPGAPP